MNTVSSLLAQLMFTDPNVSLLESATQQSLRIAGIATTIVALMLSPLMIDGTYAPSKQGRARAALSKMAIWLIFSLSTGISVFVVSFAALLLSHFSTLTVVESLGVLLGVPLGLGIALALYVGLRDSRRSRKLPSYVRTSR